MDGGHTPGSDFAVELVSIDTSRARAFGGGTHRVLMYHKVDGPLDAGVIAPSGGPFEEMRKSRELRQILENPVGPTAESPALVFGDARDDAPIRVRRDISAHAVADLGERGGLG